ncbi:MAG: hypothetical protein GY859_28760 [Desulfobacterales bacterium]|nr:hypothetical protein [Desulfobacterales bacterium]
MKDKTMKYPLIEKIGKPELLVGREKECRRFGKWIDNIPEMLSKSRVILARRKSGKTSFVQRIYNRLWNENGDVIPFYFSIADTEVWLPSLAINYYRAFASQYISFLERDEILVDDPLTLAQIRDYGAKNAIDQLVVNVDALLEEKHSDGLHNLMWETASAAPHRFAARQDRRFLVIIDEFQNLSQYVYPDPHFQTSPIKSLPGSYHSLSESKIAPMLVTGSYVELLIEIAGKYLEAGRLSNITMTPYLTAEEGLQAVYKYAEVYKEPITNASAVLINRLCMSDPFFISCVFQNDFDGRDLTTREGVIDAVNYQITNRKSEMSATWKEYIEKILKKINDRNSKDILLHLSKNSDRYWTPKELKKELQIDLDEKEIQKRLHLMVAADVIEWGSSDIQFRGLQDGTLNLILRNRFEEEIRGFAPDLTIEFHDRIKQLEAEKKSLRGMLNNLSGKFAEYQLAAAIRSRKRFTLSDFFNGVKDTTKLNIIDVRQRVPIQRDDGKGMEFDVIAESSCGRVVAAEVKKTKDPTGLNIVEDFYDKVNVYATLHPDKTILPAFLSLGGFIEDAGAFCKEKGIGTADKIAHF